MLFNLSRDVILVAIAPDFSCLLDSLKMINDLFQLMAEDLGKARKKKSNNPNEFLCNHCLSARFGDSILLFVAAIASTGLAI